jgi:hypothetical protein
MKTSNSVCDEKMKDSKETSSTEHREGSIRPDRPVLVILLSVSPSTTVYALSLQTPLWGISRGTFRDNMEESVCTLHFGLIASVPLSVNSTECFAAGVHGQLEPGIHGIKEKGAFSIVVSGQYRDDKDYGDTM